MKKLDSNNDDSTGGISMRYALALAVLMAGITQSAIAEESARFEWTKDKFDLVASGDVEQGKALAKKYRCQKCHNEDGVSDDIEVPSIAGQRATYMYKQLHDFKNQVRDNRDMYKASRRLSDEDMVHISTWYASLERPAAVGGGPMLVMKVCDSCHDKDIVEKDNHIEVAPILTGQVRQYLENTMLQFKQADRSNDLFERMQSVSHKLTDDEIRRLSRHYGAADIE
jgi:cytochrome c553